ncbi:MAG TPA: EAL domain-containing protein [Gammaproteobacteria bacterium]|nr:EAL domain-containing protein [Gammaproteobacteria bacterium]
MRLGWLTRHPRRWRALAFLLPLLATVWLLLAQRIEEHREAFDEALQAAVLVLERQHVNSLAMLDAMASSYQAMSEFDASRLSALAGSMQHANAGLRLVAYADWLREEEIVPFVARMHADGYPTFRVRGSGPHALADGRLGRLTIRFVEPGSPRLMGLLGLDVIRTGDDLGLIRRLVAANQGAVLPGWTPQPRFAPLVFYARPVYRGFFPPDDPAQRLVQFDGLFLFGIDPSPLLRDMAQDAGFPTLRLLPARDMPRVEGHEWVLDGQGLGLMLRDRRPVLGGARWLVAEQRLSAVGLLGVAPLWMGLAAGLLGLLLVALWQDHLQAQLAMQRKQAELDEERRRAEGAMRSISDGVLMLDEGYRLRYLNRVAAQMLGAEAEQLADRPVTEVLELIEVHHQTPVPDLREYLKRMSRGEPVPDVLLNSRHHDPIPVNLRVSHLEGHEHGGLVVAIRDNSEEHALTSRLAYQASHDPLTGLLNRTAFEQRVREAIQLAAEKGLFHALVFIDLDRFKLINDAHGHEAGDRMLKLVAEVLGNSLRDKDQVGRMGGDEFAVLLRTPDLDVARELAERIRSRLESMRFLWNGQAMDLHASLGVVAIDATSGTYEDLMKNADLACHAAKEAGRNTVHVFQPDDRAVGEHRRQIQWLPRLREALEKDQFVLHRQAIWPARGHAGTPAMFEFLLRLRDGEEDLPPGLFLPAAERYDMMREIDRHVIGLAMEAMGDPECMPPGSVCTVNLSGQSLTDESLVDHILNLAELHEVDPGRVCFEITETAAISSLEVARQLAGALRGRGFRLMLDDFGAGMSSLGYLHSLQVDFIKIDGQFVRNAVSDPLSAVSVRMICEIARVLGVETVAEMIEDNATVLAMRDYGVDYLQGFHLSRPEPVPRSRHLRLAYSRAGR